MKVRFRELPGTADAIPRPLVDVQLPGLARLPMTCLLDTGSLHNRFDGGLARLAGLDLTDIEPERIGIGGRPVIARTIPVMLRLGDFEWEAPVSFCEPWPWDFQLLGQEGFFRWFRVVFEAANRTMDIRPQK